MSFFLPNPGGNDEEDDFGSLSSKWVQFFCFYFLYSNSNLSCTLLMSVVSLPVFVNFMVSLKLNGERIVLKVHYADGVSSYCYILCLKNVTLLLKF